MSREAQLRRRVKPGKCLGDAHSRKRECLPKNSDLGRSLADSGMETEARYGGTVIDKVKGNKWPEWNRFYQVGRLEFSLLAPSKYTFLSSNQDLIHYSRWCLYKHISSDVFTGTLISLL